MIDTIIIGGGHAGISMSRCLHDRGISHIVLERGLVGQRWREECWDSLHLLTPNAFTRLPGRAYAGDQPEGFMTRNEWIGFLEEYCASFVAPVLTGVEVARLTASDGCYTIRSAASTFWKARSVVIATGYCSDPFIPGISAWLAPGILQLHPALYKNPSQLPPGGVLVVGCGASGVQIAEELARAGKKVIVSVGKHRRLPRVYRGQDILWWCYKMGLFDQRTDPGPKPNIPAPQLLGSPERRSVDLGILQEIGVRLAGRLVSIDGHRVVFEQGLQQTLAQADEDMASLLERVDAYADSLRLNGGRSVPAPICPLDPPAALDLDEEGISTVIWATGYRRSYPWLELDILDDKGEIRHDYGVTPAPGVYVLGIRRQIRYNSNFIDGAGQDAIELSGHLAHYLRHT